MSDFANTIICSSKLYIHAPGNGIPEGRSVKDGPEAAPERDYEGGIQKWRMVRK